MNKSDIKMKTKSVKFTWSCREITDIWTERKKYLNEWKAHRYKKNIGREKKEKKLGL